MLFSTFALLLLWACSLNRLWVIQLQVQLWPFSLSLFHSGQQEVSDSMLNSAVSLLTILTTTLILLAWQQVGVSMPGSVVSHLTILTATLVLLTWQSVSDSMPLGSVIFSLSSFLLGSHWFDRLWVILCQVQLLFLTISTLILLTWQAVSYFMLYVQPCPSHCPHSHSDFVDLTVCKWFHASVSCVSFLCSHFHFVPAGLTASEYTHARSSCASSHYLHF